MAHHLGSLAHHLGPLGFPVGPLRTWAPLWASIGRPDPPLRPFGGAIASMDAAWTSQGIILDRFWLKFEPMFDYFWSNFAYFWRSMWPYFSIFVNELFSSSLLRSHLPARLGGMRGAFESAAPDRGAGRAGPPPRNVRIRFDRLRTRRRPCVARAPNR